LQWTAKSKESCLAECTVTFKNVGKSFIELENPTLKVWVATDSQISMIPNSNRQNVFPDSF